MMLIHWTTWLIKDLITVIIYYKVFVSNAVGNATITIISISIFPIIVLC